MAKRRSTWKTAHKASGATLIERSSKGCKLAVMPMNWSQPKGAATWTVTCGRSGAFEHERGRSSTVKNAKAAATRAARKLKR